MFKNKMLVLLSLVSFGSLLLGSEDGKKGHVHATKKQISRCIESPIAPFLAVPIGMMALQTVGSRMLADAGNEESYLR